MDLLGTSDPYVKLSLIGDKLPTKKTTVKKNNLNPEWNDKFKLVVKDPESQLLQLQVYDWDKDDSTLSRQKKDAESNWKAQKAWEVAQAPMKNLLMMGFMMWMAGSTVHLFSIGITFSALWQPISALQSVGKMFEPYKDNKVELLGPKLLFIALNLGGLALGVWKLNALGLLPTHTSDWVSSLAPAQEVEFSGGGVNLG
ncbi:Synaptotagmin-3 [Glycine max]|nr:Synaptotagmin-3 [Glycine max]